MQLASTTEPFQMLLILRNWLFCFVLLTFFSAAAVVVSAVFTAKQNTRTRNGTSVLLFGLRSAQLWMSSYLNKTQCVSEPGEVPSPHCAIALDWLEWSATLPFRPVNTEGKFAADPSTAAPVGNLVTVAIFLCCFSYILLPLHAFLPWLSRALLRYTANL